MFIHCERCSSLSQHILRVSFDYLSFPGVISICQQLLEGITGQDKFKAVTLLLLQWMSEVFFVCVCVFLLYHSI